jgi:ABC-type multidrug transport system permease subunit
MTKTLVQMMIALQPLDVLILTKAVTIMIIVLMIAVVKGCVYSPINCDDKDACTTDGCDSRMMNILIAMIITSVLSMIATVILVALTIHTIVTTIMFVLMIVVNLQPDVSLYP